MIRPYTAAMNTIMNSRTHQALYEDIRANSARCESIRDSHKHADLIQSAGWMEVGMDGQAIINGSAFAGTGRSR